MAGIICANEINKGDIVLLRDGRKAEVLDNKRQSIARTVKTTSPIFAGAVSVGSMYIREWSCLPDGTRITFTDSQKTKLSKVRAAGF